VVSTDVGQTPEVEDVAVEATIRGAPAGVDVFGELAAGTVRAAPPTLANAKLTRLGYTVR
jgi:hypothetical protein